MKNENSIILKGYAWHHQDGFFFEIDTVFYKKIYLKNLITKKSQINFFYSTRMKFI